MRNFGTSAAWFDYDRDGKLDLFVANYVQWTQQNDLLLARRQDKILLHSGIVQRHFSEAVHNLGTANSKTSRESRARRPHQ